VSYSNDIGSERQIPAHFSLKFSEKEIAQRIKVLGDEIGSWCKGVWQDSHTDVLAIPVLRGGIFFFADLVRAINTSVEIAPVRTESYEVGVNNVQRSEVAVYAEKLAVKGRVVLVVDDVCDSGRTLEELEKALLARGAREVRTVVLVRRLLDRPTFVPCWTGFPYEGPEWFVGYGMDDSERWRNLPAVYIIKRDV
jgi:hypoxanthine phosphoribosyltransferase